MDSWRRAVYWAVLRCQQVPRVEMGSGLRVDDAVGNDRLAVVGVRVTRGVPEPRTRRAVDRDDVVGARVETGSRSGLGAEKDAIDHGRRIPVPWDRPLQ